KSGIEISERTPIPGLGIIQSAPLLAAFVLPAVRAAREAARRAQSQNNKKKQNLPPVWQPGAPRR
ncbi:MAG: hypothetical protein ACWGMZ_11115, partial [Thermoguttaceae bacterium]